MREETPEPLTTFTGSIWRHSRRYVVPLPKNQVGLLLQDAKGRDSLYKVQLTVRPIPEIDFTGIMFKEISSKNADASEITLKAHELVEKAKKEIANVPSVAEITKLWKSGAKFILPITPDTAEVLLPKIDTASKYLEEAIKLLKVKEVLAELLKDNQEYQELKNKLDLWRLSRRLGIEPDEEITNAIERMKAIEQATLGQALELAEKKRSTYTLRLLEGWIERPLTIRVYRFQPKTPEEAISLYRKTPIRLD